MRRLAPLGLAALLAAPAPAAARIRVVDLRTAKVKTVAAAKDARPLAWRGDGVLGAVAGPAGTTVRRYPGGRLVLRWPGASDVTLRGDRVAGVTAATEHADRVLVRTLRGRRLAARAFAGFVDSLAWSRDGARLAVGWTAHTHRRSHLSVLTARLRPVRTVDAPSSVSMSATAWSPDGRTLTYLADSERLGESGGPRPGEVRSLDVGTGRQTVRFRGTRCTTLACELLYEPATAPGGRVAFVRDFTGVTLLRPGARPQALRLPPGCNQVDDVAWAGTSLAVAYADGRTTRLALLPQRHTVATLGRGEVDRLVVRGRRVAVG